MTRPARRVGWGRVGSENLKQHMRVGSGREVTEEVRRSRLAALSLTCDRVEAVERTFAWGMRVGLIMK